MSVINKPKNNINGEKEFSLNVIKNGEKYLINYINNANIDNKYYQRLLHFKKYINILYWSKNPIIYLNIFKKLNHSKIINVLGVHDFYNTFKKEILMDIYDCIIEYNILPKYFTLIRKNSLINKILNDLKTNVGDKIHSDYLTIFKILGDMRFNKTSNKIIS